MVLKCLCGFVIAGMHEDMLGLSQKNIEYKTAPKTANLRGSLISLPIDDPIQIGV
jgi:hypothetical protein